MVKNELVSNINHIKYLGCQWQLGSVTVDNAAGPTPSLFWLVSEINNTLHYKKSVLSNQLW